MSDITKCTGTIKRDDCATPYVCPWRSTCWRHISDTDERWQSWFARAPIEWDPLTGAATCKYRLPPIRIVGPAQERPH